MSGGAFHVHGPHDHELEHQAQSGDGFAARLAVITAILATVGAMVSYQAGNTQNSALLFKNEAAIKKTEASNQWSFYQAKSSKQNLAELGATLAAPEIAEKYRKEAERYKSEKDEIMTEAKRLEGESKEADAKSEAEMHTHHRWAQSLTLLQVAIALAAITLLTRKAWMQWAAYGIAGVGAALGVLALLHI